MKQMKYNLMMRASLSSEQEDQLIGYLKGSLEDMEERLRKMQKFGSDPITGRLMSVTGGMGGNMLRDRITALLADYEGKAYFYSYYKLEKIDSTHYAFSAPDPEELFGVVPPSVVKKLIGKKDKMLEGLQSILRKVGVEQGGFKITTETAKADVNV